MDPVTHVLAAVTAAEILAPRGAEAGVVVAAAGAALAPDLDFIARRLGHIGLLKFHHTFTHSFVGIAALAAVWGALVALVLRVPWHLALAFALLGALTHVGLDLILHNNGLMLWWPFDRRMVRGSWFLGLNPFTSSARCGERKLTVCLLCQAHSVIRNRVTLLLAMTAAAAAAAWPWRRWVCLGGFALTLGYVFYVFILRARAGRLARAALGPKLEVFPASFDGRTWLAVTAAEVPGTYAAATVDINKREVGPPRRHEAAASELKAATAGRPAVAAFLENAIFPFAGAGPNGRSVWWTDLAYDFAPDVTLHTLKIELDEKGEVVNEEFRERW